ncbi:MAG TPA: PLP-dependent transferase [Gemmatimonadetes bacterium]|jgi:cystathionine beta-lyase/cystathionine gamma-synthase|nr:PLP-dependent transferase [Gemmatimonadota bacterium]
MKKLNKNLRFGTLSIHAGQEPDPTTGAIITPIFQTSTFVQPGVAEPIDGYDYARVKNPTCEALEGNFAALEKGEHGIAFSSGLAAIEAVVKCFSAGDHVICEENTYGGVTRLFTKVLSNLGLDFSFVDTRDANKVQQAMRPSTRLVHVETPTNPMMRICDLEAMAEITRDANTLLMVDNTFASPYNQQPLTLGADIAVHSSTKYLNGHSDIIGGLLATNDSDLADHIRFVRKSTGGVPGPMDAWLCLRGTKTLHIRMERHNQNGLAVAHYLESHKAIKQVIYPGLDSHPQYELAKKQMSGFSGMVSIDLGNPQTARTFAESTRIFQLAESLGGVESLISVPALQTHASVPADLREQMGVTEGLVRLSVGIEDIDDLMEDIEQALP